MKFSQRELMFLAFGGIALAAMGYLAYQSTNASDMQPRYEGEAAMAGLGGLLTVFEHLNTGDHYFHPGYCADGQEVKFTPHRYPTVSGGNITALIHQGFDGMRKPAPQDSDWMIQPPGSEVL